jgi:putative hydrolase of the HAD superfamily
MVVTDLTLLFDYDDTLQENQHDYSWPQLDFMKFVRGKFRTESPNGHLDYGEAQLFFAEYMLRALDFHAPDVQTMLKMVAEQHESLGGAKESFPDALQATYTTICEGAHITPNGVDIVSVLTLGKRVTPSQTRAPDVKTLIDLEASIDSARVKDLGFSKERFPGSLRLAYLAVCEQLGVTPDEADAREAYRIGTEAFDVDNYRRKGLLKGVPETLDYLADRGASMVLVTKGDREVQKNKLAATDVKRWFGDRMHIVPKKDAQVIHDVLEREGIQDYSSVWHVGNGLKSDVEPAISAGIGAIYIPRETWHFERSGAKRPENGARFIELKRFSDLRQVYDLL